MSSPNKKKNTWFLFIVHSSYSLSKLWLLWHPLRLSLTSLFYFQLCTKVSINCEYANIQISSCLLTTIWNNNSLLQAQTKRHQYAVSLSNNTSKISLLIIVNLQRSFRVKLRHHFGILRDSLFHKIGRSKHHEVSLLYFTHIFSSIWHSYWKPWCYISWCYEQCLSLNTHSKLKPSECFCKSQKYCCSMVFLPSIFWLPSKWVEIDHVF